MSVQEIPEHRQLRERAENLERALARRTKERDDVVDDAERLREERDEWQTKAGENRADYLRLREQLKEQKRINEFDRAVPIAEMREKMEAQDRLVERLRKALERISNLTDAQAQLAAVTIARAALKGNDEHGE